MGWLVGWSGSGLLVLKRGEKNSLPAIFTFKNSLPAIFTFKYSMQHHRLRPHIDAAGSAVCPLLINKAQLNSTICFTICLCISPDLDGYIFRNISLLLE
jgi:hypothetical protein